MKSIFLLWLITSFTVVATQEPLKAGRKIIPEMAVQAILVNPMAALRDEYWWNDLNLLAAGNDS